jgi:hypothetical protein
MVAQQGSYLLKAGNFCLYTYNDCLSRHEVSQRDYRSVICEEKNRLVREYKEATVVFSEAVKELRRRMGTSPKEEYKRVQRIATEARLKSEQARFSVEHHIATHGC